jgi:hypothetical protein
MTLGSTQPLTEMSTRGKGGQCVGLTTLPPSCAPQVHIYIYTMLKFLALQGAPCIYDISRLIVNTYICLCWTVFVCTNRLEFASLSLVECYQRCGYYTQVIVVRELSEADGAEDYLIGERGNQKGKVPKAFLELLAY